MAADGFPQVGAAESIAAGYPTPEDALAGLIIDSGVSPPGHRYQLLSIGGVPYTGEQQTGVGIVLNGTGSYHNYYTIDSGYTADTSPFLLGVVYSDLNHNGLYDNGEGLGGVTITAIGSGGTYQTTTWGSGGYNLQVLPGIYTVTASGGAMGSGVSRVVAVGLSNYRLNFNPPIVGTTTGLTADNNPSYAGEALTLTATVANGRAGGPAPAGSVEFFDGATDLGPGNTLVAGGSKATSTFTTAALAPGTHALRAVFQPSGAFSGSQGKLTQTVTADHLDFAVPPGDAAAGQALSPAVQVSVVDQYGNVETGDNSDQVTLKVTSGPGGFTAGSTATATVSGGVATFGNLVLDTAGSYTLGARSVSEGNALTGPTSAAFTVSPAGADHLAFTVPPGAAAAGAALSPAVQVAVVDQYGNVETGDNTDQVTLSVASGPGGFTAGSTTTATVNGGLAVFSNLVLTTQGTYTLSASATGGLTGPNSASFPVALFADSFNRANSSTLGAGWVQMSGVMGVRGNQLVGGAAPALAVYRSAWLTNTGVQTSIALPVAGTQYAGLVARYAGPGLANFYLGQVVGNNGRFAAYLYRNLRGTWALLASGPAARGTGTLRLEVVGSSLKLFLNGQLLTYAFDSSPVSGITGVWGGAGATLGNFAGGPISLDSAALPFTDGFGGAAGSQLSRSWTERSGNFAQQGNGQLRANAAGISLATVNLATAADVTVQADIQLSTTGTQAAGLVSRYSASSSYVGEVVGVNGVFRAYLLRYTAAGGWVELKQAAVSGGTGTLRLTIEGDRLQLFFNDLVNPVCDRTDAGAGAITGPGLAGLRAGPGALFANFSAAAP
jgi:hypothetical protein